MHENYQIDAKIYDQIHGVDKVSQLVLKMYLKDLKYSEKFLKYLKIKSNEIYTKYMSNIFEFVKYLGKIQKNIKYLSYYKGSKSI